MYTIGSYTNSFDGKCNPKFVSLDPVQSAQSALVENCGQEALKDIISQSTHLHYDEDHTAEVDGRLQGGHGL